MASGENLVLRIHEVWVGSVDYKSQLGMVWGMAKCNLSVCPTPEQWLYIMGGPGVSSCRPRTSTSCQISSGIRLKIRCTVNMLESSGNHPHLTPVGKLASLKPVPGPERLGTTGVGRIFLSLTSPALAWFENPLLCYRLFRPSES